MVDMVDMAGRVIQRNCCVPCRNLIQAFRTQWYFIESINERQYVKNKCGSIDSRRKREEDFQGKAYRHWHGIPPGVTSLSKESACRNRVTPLKFFQLFGFISKTYTKEIHHCQNSTPTRYSD